MRLDRSLLAFALLFFGLITVCLAEEEPEIVHLVRDSQNHLFMPLTIDGVQSWWGIDTGFPFSVIDTSVAARANLSQLSGDDQVPLSADVNGQVCPVVEATNVKVGSMDLGRLKVAALNLEVKPYIKSDEVGSSFEMGGILGIDFLLKFNAVINFQHQVIELFPTEKPPPPRPLEAEYQSIPLETASKRRMEVLCRVGLFSYPFAIDTGAAGTSASIEIAKQNELQTRPYTSASVGKSAAKTEFASIEDFQIGDFDCGTVELNFMVSAKPSMLLRGLLGADLLTKYGAILDVGKNELFLKRP